MSDAYALVVIVALVVVALLVVAVLVRTRSASASREAALREVTELRARIDVLAATSADFERDLRQDFASARAEQAAAAQGLRTELGAILAQHLQTMRDQLHGIGGVQNDQMKQVADRVSDLTKSNEQRLEAVRATVDPEGLFIPPRPRT